MFNYILADMRRIAKKKSFIFTLVAFAALFLLMMFIFYNATFAESAYITKTSSFLSFSPLVIGLAVFLSIYYDDFKSKAMQIAIGYGISRSKVIVVKMIETILATVLAMLVLSVLILLLPIFMGLSLTGAQYLEIAMTMLVEMLRVVGYTSMATMFVYGTQNAMTGTILYVLLASKTIMIILATLLGQEFVINMIGDLTQYLYTGLLYTAKWQFLTGAGVGVVSIVAILIYIMLPTAVAMLVFKKKELEF